MNEKFKQIDTYLKAELEKNELLIEFSKWGGYLPIEYQVEIMKERCFDFEGAMDLLNNMNLVGMK